VNLNPSRIARDTTPPARGRIVVLGLGDTQWGDAGVGVRVVEQFKTRWQCAPHVDVAEGGMQGRALLPLVESAEKMIVIKSVDFGLAPGTLRVRVDDDAVERLRARGKSLHPMDFADALACAQLKGCAPRRIVLIGVQPLELDAYGADLSPPVRAALDMAVEATCHRLRRWRAAPQRRAVAGPGVCAGLPGLVESYADSCVGIRIPG
jgi:hydrogenase maturation protease